MPRRKVTAPTEDVTPLTFKFMPAQRRSLMNVRRGAGTYVTLKSPQCLEIGGIRSGKTVGKLMHFVLNYCLRWSYCDILVLRRTFSELEQGVITDFKTFVPQELYTYNAQSHIATFKNGSRVIFAGCVNNQMRDIEKYLGQSYPAILVDECGQFSPEAWMLLYSRNLVNARCQPDEHGNMPVPTIVGCTNPLGPFWEFYHSVFVIKEPWQHEEGMRRAEDGSYWVPVPGDEPRLIYDPRLYFSNHTTVLDNDEYRKRDPGIVARLNALPPAQRNKMLLGLMDREDGQYFDCFDEDRHVVDLRVDPEAVRFQDWQPVWAGQDFGVGHWNAIYLFTKAYVRTGLEKEYRMKTVCFQEVAPEMTGYTNVQLADMLKLKAFYPRLPADHPDHERISGKPCKIQAIYFSHEKFSRVMEAHSPADDYSRLLRERGLPPVSRATMDRIGSATFMYNMLKRGELVVLATCPGIIRAIPALQRDPDNLDDVLKVDAKADDRYDAFRYGLYGMLKGKQTPEIERARERAEKIPDLLNRYFYLKKQEAIAKDAKSSFKQQEVPYWQTK